MAAQGRRAQYRQAGRCSANLEKKYGRRGGGVWLGVRWVIETAFETVGEGLTLGEID